jgi:hypothetical protein
MGTRTFRTAAGLMAALALAACSSNPDVPTDDNRGEGIDYEARVAVESMPAPASLGCVYPSGGASGATVGATVPANLAWQGYDIQSNQSALIPVTRFFDCDGSKGFHSLYFDTSKFL